MLIRNQDNSWDVCRSSSVSIKYFVWKCRPISFGRHRSFCHFCRLTVSTYLLSLTSWQLPSGILRECICMELFLFVFLSLRVWEIDFVCVCVQYRKCMCVTFLQLKELFSVFFFYIYIAFTPSLSTLLHLVPYLQVVVEMILPCGCYFFSKTGVLIFHQFFFYFF